MEQTESRSKFSGKMGFILATAGSAVGLGNLWRFPYLAETYGGGIFLLVYLVLVVTFGICMMITELAIGRRTGKSSILALMELGAKYKILGWMGAIVPVIVVSYYCVIGGWVSKYLVEYVGGSGSELITDGFFDSFTGASLGNFLDGPMPWFLIYAALTLVVVMFGVEKGIERFSKVLMPVLLVVLVVICGYMLTLPGISEGLRYYLVPDFSQFSMKTVLGAMGQLFYSLSIAMGILIAYGSYMKKDVNIAKSARVIGLTDTSVAFLSGLMVVPAVVVFSEIGMSSGPGLMFETLPLVFEAMPGGHLVAILFFALALFAAWTSSVALAEAVVASLMDRFRMSRTRACGLCTLFILVLGSLAGLGYGPLNAIQPLGMVFLDFFDFITNSLLMPILALAIAILIGHIIGTKYVTDEVEGLTASPDDPNVDRSGFGSFPSRRMYVVMTRWVCPIGVFVILVTGLLDLFGIYTI